MSDLKTPVREALRQRLSDYYGGRLADVLLYGSHARGEARPDSDVDVLAVLRGPYDPFAELAALTRIELDFLSEHGVLLSIQPFAEEEVADLGRPFMRNVREEAVPL
jgi:uncharacterized protein